MQIYCLTEAEGDFLTLLNDLKVWDFCDSNFSLFFFNCSYFCLKFRLNILSRSTSNSCLYVLVAHDFYSNGRPFVALAKNFGLVIHLVPNVCIWGICWNQRTLNGSQEFYYMKLWNFLFFIIIFIANCVSFFNCQRKEFFPNKL